MDLHEFNVRVLGSIGIVDETGSGHLSRVLGPGQTSPFKIGDKRVVLPLPQHLRSDETNIIVYHPLSENITRSESDMIKSLRDQIMFRLTMVSVQLITELGRVAATKSEHARLDKESSKYLKELANMDEKSYEFLRKVILRIGPEPEKRLISISLRKNNKDGVLRSAKFKFPVLDQLLTDEHELLGVKYPSKKARNNLIALFEFVLGDAEKRASYDYGSKNMAAPYFHALMTGFQRIAEHLNDVTKRHRKLLGQSVDQECVHDLADDLLIDLSWTEAMDDLGELRKVVPPQEGNEGSIIVAEPKEKERAAEVVSSRLAPATRSSSETRRDEPADRIDVPWDDEPRAASRETRREPERRTGGKTLDEYLGVGRSREPDRRQYDRREEDRWGRGRGDREPDRRWGRDEPRGRRYDLGLDRDHDDRDRGRWSSQDFRRDEPRGSGRRPFGSGQMASSRGRF